ncbi:unnamed protein product [Trichobilharzia szidati]|nr:unnamed protein product [Trichobilharzia szidati]
MYNSRSPHRSPWSSSSPNARQDHFQRPRFTGHPRSPITLTPPFGNERFPRYPQDSSFYWSSPPPVNCSPYQTNSPARYGTPNFNQSSYQQSFYSPMSSYATPGSSCLPNCNSPMNMHYNSVSSGSYSTAQEDLSWKYDTSYSNSSICNANSFSPRNSGRKFGENRNHPVKNWIVASLSDPWEGLKPVRTPLSGYLVDKPPAQTHTILFAPHERRRKLELDNGEKNTISPTKRIQLVGAE